MENKEQGKYFPNAEELDILKSKINEYFDSQDRSASRKLINQEILDTLNQKGYTHWTLVNVRLWFNNNKSKYYTSRSEEGGQLRPPENIQPYQPETLGYDQQSPMPSAGISRLQSISSYGMDFYDNVLDNETSFPTQTNQGYMQKNQQYQNGMDYQSNQQGYNQNSPYQNSPGFPQNQQNQQNQSNFNQNSPYQNSPGFPQNQQNQQNYNQNPPYQNGMDYQSNQQGYNQNSQFQSSPGFPQNQPNQPNFIQNSPGFPQNQPNQPNFNQNSQFQSSPGFPQNQQNQPNYNQNTPYQNSPGFPQNPSEFLPPPPVLAPPQKKLHISVDTVEDDLIEDDDNNDNIKFNLYRKLKNIYKRAYQSSDFPLGERIEEQTKLESELLEVLKKFNEALSISNPLLVDKNPKFYITPQRKKGIPRQFSTTSNIYAKDKSKAEEIDMKPTTQYTSIPSDCKIGLRTPKELLPFYKGNTKINSEKFPCVEASCFDGSESVIVSYDKEKQLSFIKYQNRMISLGFYSEPTSVCVDKYSEAIWIAGDTRVRGFKISNIMSCRTDGEVFDDIDAFDTLSITKSSSFINTEPLDRSIISASEKYVYLANENKIFVWEKEGPESTWPISEPMMKMVRKYAKEAGYDDNNIIYNSGRSEKRVIHVSFGNDSVHQITSMVALPNDQIAVASETYPVVFVYDIKEEINLTQKLIGHTGGITNLSLSGNNLIISSVDLAVRAYSIDNFKILAHVDNGSGDLTTCGELVSFQGENQENLLFLCGLEKEKKEETNHRSGAVVKTYDLSKRREICEISIPEGIPTSVSFVEGGEDGKNSTLYVLASTQENSEEKDPIKKIKCARRGNSYLYSIEFLEEEEK